MTARDIERSLLASVIVIVVLVAGFARAHQTTTPAPSPESAVASPTPYPTNTPTIVTSPIESPSLVPFPTATAAPTPAPTPTWTPGPGRTPPACCTADIGTAMVGGWLSHMGSAPVGPLYVATPFPRGTRIRLCGADRCRVLTTNDRGPSRRMQMRGRIADVSVELFVQLCGKPASAGLCRGSIEVLR